jgi:acyl-CoA thioester hydrolase
MSIYKRKVNYHETDKMGITHHSNYIKWMEEARIYYFSTLGLSYAELEKNGVGSPVVNVNCKYILPTTFDDEIDISVKFTRYNGVILNVEYAMVNAKTGKTVCTATSESCFVDMQGKLVSIKNVLPETHEKIKEKLNENKI